MDETSLNQGTRFKQEFQVAKNIKQIVLNQQKLINLSNKKFVDKKTYFGQIISSQIYTKKEAISLSEASFVKTLSPSSTKFIGYKVFVPALNGIYPSFKDSELAKYLEVIKLVSTFFGKKYDIETLMKSKSKQDRETIYMVGRNVDRYPVFFCAGDNQEPQNYPQYCEIEIEDIKKPIKYGVFKRVIGDELTKVDYEPKESDF